jgi:hypothetical protein
MLSKVKNSRLSVCFFIDEKFVPLTNLKSSQIIKLIQILRLLKTFNSKKRFDDDVAKEVYIINSN